jgi:hypothetical protein
VLGIDRIERASQAAVGEVAIDDAAERALALGGADQRDAASGEKRPQVMGNRGQAPILFGDLSSN